MAIEKKIYSSWAFKENESEKARCNREIYKELCESTRFQDIRWRIRTITTLFWIEHRDIITQLTASSKIIPNCHSWSLL